MGPRPAGVKGVCRGSLAGTRDTYISGVPSDVAERIPAEHWEEDWRVLNPPGANYRCQGACRRATNEQMPQPINPV